MADDVWVRPPHDGDGWRIIGRSVGVLDAAVLRLSEHTALAVDPGAPDTLLWAVAGADASGEELVRAWLGPDGVDRARAAATTSQATVRPDEGTIAIGRAALCAFAGSIDSPDRWGLWSADLLAQLSRAGLREPFPLLDQYVAAAAASLADLRLRLVPERGRLLDLVRQLRTAELLGDELRASFEPALDVLDTDSGLDLRAFDSPTPPRPASRPVLYAPLRSLGRGERQLVDAVCWLDVTHRLGLDLDSRVSLVHRSGHGRLTISGVTRPDGVGDLYVRVLGVAEDGACTTLDITRGAVDPASASFVATFTLESAARFGFERVMIDVVPVDVAVTEPDDLATSLGRAFGAAVTKVALARRRAHDVTAALAVAGTSLVILGLADSAESGRTLAADIASRIDLSFVTAGTVG